MSKVISIIKLKIRFEPPFNIITKILNDELQFEKELKLRELFEYFYEKYGDEFRELLWDKKDKEKFSSFLSIIINGNSYRGKNFKDTLLKDGDDISFLYLYFGG